MCPYLASFQVEDIMGKTIGLRSAESRPLFFGRLTCFDKGKSGCYLVMNNYADIPRGSCSLVNHARLRTALFKKRWRKTALKGLQKPCSLETDALCTSFEEWIREIKSLPSHSILRRFLLSYFYGSLRSTGLCSGKGPRRFFQVIYKEER